MKIAPSEESVDAEQPGARAARAPRLKLWLGLFAAVWVALGTWFLVGPLFGPTAWRGYYRPVLGVFTYGYDRPILLSLVFYGLALAAWWRGARVPLRLLVAGAVGLHLLLLFAPPQQSQDLWQYLFYGRMQAVHHANPYLVQPAVFWRDPWYNWSIRWPTQTTVYGPAWTLLTAGVVALAHARSIISAFLLYKLVILAMDLAILRMLVVLAREREAGESGRPGDEGAAGWAVLLFAWNPLVLLTIPLGGLVDTAVVAGLVGAVLARRRGRLTLTTVLLVLATLVKLYAGIALALHLLLLLRRRGLRRAVTEAGLAGAVTVALSAVYWDGPQTFRGVVRVAGMTNKSLLGTIQNLLEPALRAVGVTAPEGPVTWALRVLAIAVVGAAIVVAAWRVRDDEGIWHGSALVLAAFAISTPWFLYWYLLAPLALVAATRRTRLTAPMLTFSGTALFSLAFPPWLLAQALQAIVRYAPPVLGFVRRWGAPAGPAETALRLRPDAALPADPDGGAVNADAEEEPEAVAT